MFICINSLIHSKRSFCVVLEVYIAFLLPASKCFLSVLSSELALHLNISLKLPLLKLLVVLSSLWPLKPIPYLPKNSKHLIIDIKNSLFSSNFSLFFLDIVTPIPFSGLFDVLMNSFNRAIELKWYSVKAWFLMSLSISLQSWHGSDINCLATRCELSGKRTQARQNTLSQIFE